MGGKTQNTTTTQNQNSSSDYTSKGTSQLQSIWDKLYDVTSQPYKAYTGQLTAPLNSTEQSGISNIESAQGTAQPYYDTASGYATTGAAPITQDAISSYISPYTQDVVDKTKDYFKTTNAEDNSKLLGNAAAVGALGGDRVGVQQGELKRQESIAQAPVIADLYDKGYSQALGAAQSDRTAAANAATTFGQLGTAAQNAKIAGGESEIKAGQVAQDTSQKDLDAQYNQYLQEQAFPYQQAGYLSTYGTAPANDLGYYSTTTGDTTKNTATEGPSQAGQYAGLGLTAASLLLARGGRIPGYATGGVTDLLSVPTYIPSFGKSSSSSSSSSSSGSGTKTASSDLISDDTSKSSSSSSLPSSQSISTFGDKLLSAGTKGDDVLDQGNSIWGTYSATPSYADTMGDWWTQAGQGTGPWAAQARGGRINGYADGGFINTVHHLRHALRSRHRYADGGATPFTQSLPITGPLLAAGRGYDDGGDISPFNQAWADTATAINDGTFDPVGSNYPNVPDIGAPAGSAPVVAADIPLPQARPANAPAAVADTSAPQVDLPPPITGSTDEDSLPTDAMAYDTPQPGAPAGGGGQPQGSPYAMMPGAGMAMPQQQPRRGGLLSALGLPSPFSGLSDEARTGLLAAGLGMMASKSKFPLTQIGEGGLQGLSSYSEAVGNKRKADQEAAKLMQQAQQFAQTHGLEEQKFEEAKRKAQVPSGYRMKDDGSLEFIPGGPADPATARAQAAAKRLPGMSDEALEKMVDSYRAGNTGILVGVGRGTQGADNLNRFWNVMAEKMKEEGATGKDLAAAKASFSAQSAAAKTAAVREANVATAVEEAKNTFPLALQRSAELPRTQFVPWNKAVQMVQAGTSSPELARFVTANQAVITAYSQAISRTGVNTVNAQHHAENLLSTATSPEAYAAVIGQMEQEMQAALTAPDAVRARVLRGISGRTENPAPTPAPSPAPTVTQPPARVKQNGHTYEKQPDGNYKAID